MDNPNESSIYETSSRQFPDGETVDFRYGVPFEWGSLHVSQAAHEMYGFIPLTPDVINDSSLDQSKKGLKALKTDVYFVSPEELYQRINLKNADTVTEEGAIITYAGKQKTGFELFTAINRTKEEIQELHVEDIEKTARLHGLDIEDMLDNDDIPPYEYIKQNTLEHVLHKICRTTAQSVQDIVAEHLRENADKMALRSITQIGGIGLASAGIVIGSDAIEGIALTPFSVGSALGFISFSGYLARRTMKDYLQTVRHADIAHDQVAAVYALAVSRDIYKTYSKQYFDQQAEAMFKDE